MATGDKTRRNGRPFLSKVARFIANPATDWADLGGQSDAGGLSDSGVALKQIIERKRHNDSVRKREFAQLRKQREADARTKQKPTTSVGFKPSADSVASSNSVSSGRDPRKRQKALRKIDRIEAQMSRQWLTRGEAGEPEPDEADEITGTWTGRGSTHEMAQAATLPVSMSFDVPNDDARPPEVSPKSQSPEVIDASVVLGLDTGADEPPDQLVEPVVIPRAHDNHGDEKQFLPPHEPVAAEPLPIINVGPELEEVAARFANGDAAGAEVRLLELVDPQGGQHDNELAWLTLFDLYRAVGNMEAFDGASGAFIAQFGRSAPQWSDIGVTGADAPRPVARAALLLADWTAPAEIDLQAITQLMRMMVRQAQPWKLDWRRVGSIAPDAVSALLQLFSRWLITPVQLQFRGADQFLSVLVAQTPVDEHAVDGDWWLLRLAYLRLLGEADEFELAALNYCMTYEMSPPQWQDPACTVTRWAEPGSTGATPLAEGGSADAEGVVVAPDVGDGIARLTLTGELLTGLPSTLAKLPIASETRLIELDCRALTRVDFGAAAALINWIIEQQAGNRDVSFRSVNRLVAAFFSVIGIHDVARVTQRID